MNREFISQNSDDDQVVCAQGNLDKGNGKKVDPEDAVEKNFNTKVQKVRTVQVKGKIKQRGRIIGKRSDWKKAIVTLMPGQRIDFFEGV